MKIYNFDAGTKHFVSEGIADESPLEPGVFLLPANATFQEPPKTVSNEMAIWDGEKWNVELIPEPTNPEQIVDPVPPTWDDIKNKRNWLLFQSDWTQLPDVALSGEEVATWRAYRSELREITKSFESPQSVVWPAAL